MSAEQTRQTLAELCLDISYGYTASACSDPVGPKFLRITDIQGGEVDWSNVPYCEANESARRKNKLVYGDIVIARTGNSTGENFIFDSEEEAVFASYLIRFRVDPSLANPYFVWLQLRTNSWWSYVTGAKSGSAQAGANARVLGQFEISLPARVVQDRVETVVRSFYRKIQLNHRINQTLEQMAQALFKSWFVDFEPVKAKAATLEAGGNEEDALLAAMEAVSGKTSNQLATLRTEQPERYAELRATAELFPSAMQDSELGEIPEGWEVTAFGAVSACHDKHRIPLSKRQREQRQGTIPYYGATSVMGHVDDFIFNGIYLLLGEDGSVIRDDGTPYTQYIWGKTWVNNHAHVLQGANGVSTEQLMLFISAQNISAYVTGAVQLKLNQKNMNSIPFIKAPNELNTRFYDFVAPMYSQLRILTDENEALTHLRDTLLPKLLSGELTLPDVEEAQAEPQDVAYV